MRRMSRHGAKVTSHFVPRRRAGGGGGNSMAVPVNVTDVVLWLINRWSRWGGSKNRNPRIPPKFTKSSVFHRPVVSATCLNQQLQPPTLSRRRTWTVDETEVA